MWFCSKRPTRPAPTARWPRFWHTAFRPRLELLEGRAVPATLAAAYQFQDSLAAQQPAAPVPTPPPAAPKPQATQPPAPTPTAPAKPPPTPARKP